MIWFATLTWLIFSTCYELIWLWLCWDVRTDSRIPMLSTNMDERFIKRITVEQPANWDWGWTNMRHNQPNIHPSSRHHVEWRECRRWGERTSDRQAQRTREDDEAKGQESDRHDRSIRPPCSSIDQHQWSTVREWACKRHTQLITDEIKNDEAKFVQTE